jgi:murein DD-endopeptidase MepM/ murein hydrolase activator NlpD
MLASFYVGGAAGWFLHAAFKPPAAGPADAIVEPKPIVDTRHEPRDERAPIATSGGRARETAAVASPERVVATIGPNPIAELRRHRLQLPIDDAKVDAMEGGFDQRRDGGSRGHEAVDILAPRHTPVRAVDDGTVAKLFTSKAGGITLYQFDPTGRFCYYYAHLDRYAEGLREGQRISRGDVIGYVGTTGNAPANTPHLHFAVYELTADKRWWEGRPLDPYLIFEKNDAG